MSQEIINYGASANDGQGDPLRTAFIKTDENFSQIWNAGPVGSNITVLNNTVGVTNTNGNLILSPNGIGVIQTNNHLIPRATRTYDIGSITAQYRGVYASNIFANSATISNANIDFSSLTVDVGNLHISGGTNGYVLQTDGDGNLTWTEQTGGGGNGTPGGANTQVQFNDAGTFGGSASFTFNKISNVFTVPGDVLPAGNNTQSLGSATYQWNDLYLSNATIYMNSVPLSMTAGNVLTVNGQPLLSNDSNTTITTTGNITAGNISGIFVAPASTANTQILYNDSGVISGSAAFTFNENGNTLTIGTTGGTLRVADISTPQAGVNLRFIPSSGTTLSYGHLNPQFANTYDLGSGSSRWNNVFANVSNVTTRTGSTITLTSTGTAVNASQGNILTNQVTGTKFNFLSGLYTVSLDASGAGATYTFSLPGNAGANGQVLTTNGSGVTTWTTPTGVSTGNVGFDNNNIYNTQGGGLILSNFNYVTAEAETAYINIPAGDSNSDLQIVQEQGNVTVNANSSALWSFNADNSFKLPNNSNITIVDNVITQINAVATANSAINLRAFDAGGNATASSFFDGTDGTLNFYSYNSTTDTSYNWRFDNGGSFTLPNAPGNIYLGEGSTEPVIIPDTVGVTIDASRGDPGADYIAVTQDGINLFSVHTINIENNTTGLSNSDINLLSGDDITLQGRNRPADVEREGGDLFIYGGDGSDASESGFDTGSGGDLSIRSGAGGSGTGAGASGSSGGYIDITAGSGGTTTDSNAGSGGDISISAGSAGNPSDPANGGYGGGVQIRAGDTTRVNESGGSIQLTTGQGLGLGTGGAGYVEIIIPESNVGVGGTWTFSGTGTTLNVPANSEIYGANYGNFTVGCAGNTIVTSSDYGANVKNWVFGYTGNLLAPGNIITPTNFVGTSLRTNLSEFNWSANITNMNTGINTIVVLANNIFGDPWSGQITITDVGGATEANATWWYQATNQNSIELFTDSTFTTPVDSSEWGTYTGGGFAVTLDYGNIEINAQTITIRSGQADYSNRVWSFNSNGSTQFPTLTVNLHNGGNQNAQTLQFGNPDYQAVITGPTPAPGDNAQRLIIQGQNGGTGEGGDVYLWGGDADTNGGDIKIYAGDADNGAGGYGGYINIDGGRGFNSGGPVEITGGQSTGSQGAPVRIIGGQGATSGGDANIAGGQGATDNGGNVNVTAGYGANNGGAVNITGGQSAQGLPGYGNIYINAGATSWAFDNAGNLSLPISGKLVGATPNNNGYLNWVGASSGDGGGYTTMNLVPDDTRVGGDQYLILDPTAPGHIHIRAGGTQDNSSADLFLGGENSYFRVGAGANSATIISANSFAWTFDTDGVVRTSGEFTLRAIGDTVNLQTLDPGSGNIYSTYLGTNGGLYFTGTEYLNGWLNITHTSGNADVNAPAGNINIQPAYGVGNGPAKSITLRGGTADQSDFYTGTGGAVNIIGGLGSSNDGGGGGPGGNINLTSGTSSDPAGHAGNINITAGGNAWVFDYTGNLTLPSNTFAVNYANGTAVSLGGNYGNANVATFLAAYGSNTISTTGNITAGNLIGNISITGNVTGTSPNVTLIAGSYSYTFDNTGVLTLPASPTGNEGSEIQFTQAGNSTLGGNTVNIDQYVDLIRFFESGGSNRGLVIDIANAPAVTNAVAIGYRDIPQITLSANVTANSTNAGQHFYSTTAGNLQVTIPDNANVAYPTGATLTIVMNAAGNVIVAQGTGVTLYMAGSSTTGNRTVGAYGLASVMKVATNTWVISGTGVY